MRHNPEIKRKVDIILRMPDKQKFTKAHRLALQAWTVLLRLDNSLNIAINASR